MFVVVFITSRKDKGNLSSPKTVFFYLHFPRWTFPVLAYHGADLWLPTSKGWTLAPQRCCSLWELLSSWLASCTRTQPGLCIVCGSSSRSLWTRHPDQEVFLSLSPPGSQNHMHAVLSSHMPVLSSGARTLNTSIELSILLTGSTLDLTTLSQPLWVWESEVAFFLVILHILPTLRRPSGGSQLLGFILSSLQ